MLVPSTLNTAFTLNFSEDPGGKTTWMLKCSPGAASTFLVVVMCSGPSSSSNSASGSVDDGFGCQARVLWIDCYRNRLEAAEGLVREKREKDDISMQ
jgi:hypothetical protein